MTPGRTLRILFSAYACEPGAGSEPGIGWNLATALAERHDVWVVTRANNRPAIEAALERYPHPRLHFEYYDLPAWQHRWKRGGRGVRTYYRLWQRGAGSAAARLASRVSFDVAQHATFGQYWSPSFLARLSIPYVWGPVGGAEVFPRSLYPVAGCRAILASEARRALPHWGERQPAVRRTARRSAVALAATPEAAARLRHIGAPRVLVFPAVAITDADLRQIHVTTRPGDAGRGARFLSATRLLGTKGVELGIRGFLAADLPDASYEVAGEGPERERLERIVARAGATHSVRFLGKLSRGELLKRYAASDAFVHLSPAESGGFVCFEAMAAGLPVVHLNAGGPAVLVPESAGIRIDISSAEQVTAEVAGAMRRLAGDPAACREMGRDGRNHVLQHGTWNSRIQQLDGLFAEIMAP